MYNTLDLYRKILNLRDINEIIAMFDKSEYLDFEYDKYRYNPDIKKTYLYEKAVAKNTSRELELAFIKDKYNVFYNLYYSFFENTAFYTETTYTITDGDAVNISGLVNEDDNGSYIIDVDGATLTLKTFDGSGDLHDVELTDFSGYAELMVGDYKYTITDITFNGPDTTITLLNNNLDSVGYVWTNETDVDKETRIEETKDYRELFLRYIPNFEVFKGTQKYIEFVMKFYYLIKYWDIDESAETNQSNASNATIVTTGNIQTNFVYYVSSLIPQTAWDLYIKPCVHPHGWIDNYYDLNADIYSSNILQKEFNSLENKPTYSDVLLSNNNNILRSVSTVKKYGNVETNNDYVSIGLDVGTLCISGGYKIYDFAYYDTNNEKVESSEEVFTLPPPQFSFDGYSYDESGNITTTNITNIFYTESKLDDTHYIEHIGTYYLSDLLDYENIAPTDVTSSQSTMEGDGTPSGKFIYIVTGSSPALENNYSHTHFYIRTVIWDLEPDDNTEILYASDIVSFEIIGTDGDTNPMPNPTHPITPSVPGTT